MSPDSGHHHHPLPQHDWEEIGDDDVRSLDDYDSEDQKSIKHPLHRRQRLQANSTAPSKAPTDGSDGRGSPPTYEASEDLKSVSAPQKRRVRFALTQTQRFTLSEERSVVRKLDRRLVLFLALLYMFSFLDRSSELIPKGKPTD